MKKTLGLWGLAALLSLGLAACGGGTDSYGGNTARNNANGDGTVTGGDYNRGATDFGDAAREYDGGATYNNGTAYGNGATDGTAYDDGVTDGTAYDSGATYGNGGAYDSDAARRHNETADEHGVTSGNRTILEEASDALENGMRRARPNAGDAVRDGMDNAKNRTGS